MMLRQIHFATVDLELHGDRYAGGEGRGMPSFITLTLPHTLHT